MCKICWSTVAVLLLVVAGVLYKFVIQGDVVVRADGRAAIQLEAKERDLVLSEMRIFLESVQQITKGIADDDMMLIAESAKKSGRSAQMDVPGTLIGKLPLAFKKLGFDTHAKFDQVALDAEQLGDRDHTLSQLSELLNNCTACHAAFRFDVTAAR